MVTEGHLDEAIENHELRMEHGSAHTHPEIEALRAELDACREEIAALRSTEHRHEDIDEERFEEVEE